MSTTSTPFGKTLQSLETEVPFRSVLSFEPLLGFWREVAESSESPVLKHLARTILEKVEPVEALRGDIDDLTIVESHRHLVELMLTGVLPLALGDSQHAAALLPFKLELVHVTPAAARMGLFDAETMASRLNMSPERLFAMKSLLSYNVVLECLYDVDFDQSRITPMVITVPTESTQLERHLQLTFDPRFSVVDPTGDLPDLSADDITRLVSDPSNLSLWTEKLPPESFTFRGLTLVSATDVTHQETLSRLKNDLLHPDALTSSRRLDTVRQRLRNFLGRPELEFGLIALERGQDVDDIIGAHAVGRSILMADSGTPACSQMHDSFYAAAFESADPIIVHDLESNAPSDFEHHVLDQGYRSLIIYPLKVDEFLLGFLEIATPRPRGLNALDGLALAEVVNLFAIAMKRTLVEQEDRVQALIKQQYTAIHPVVEWRFREAAQSYLDQVARGEPPQQEPIVFRGLYPLYGLSDLRGSSRQRNESIQADLIYQLDLAASVIGAATRARSLPILDELGYRVRALNDAIQKGLSSDDESTVLDFLHQDVESLFDRVVGYGPEVRDRVAEYRDSLDPELGILYRRRKEFDRSVAQVNDLVARTLEAEEGRAQTMFPHYFEMFKTDGVDHSIYVGESLLENGGFDRLYLRNLRLWQLQVMCRIEWELRHLKPELEIPLDATHLILVQNAPLAIRFRTDEKRFDVDGAYNIRYEIVKKRIDKARVRDTTERLTQPGKLAIAYSHDKEADEYRGYLDYLEAAGYTMPGVEDLFLEDFQGVYGLRALRVSIAEEPRRPDQLRPDGDGLGIDLQRPDTVLAE